MNTTTTFKKCTALLLSASLVLGALSGCGAAADTSASSASDTVVTQLSTAAADDTARTAATLNLADAVAIQLNGTTATSDGSGVQIENGVITITKGGTYAVSGTLSEGRIVVNAPGENVTIALNGASITCSNSSPIYIYKAQTAIVHLVDGTDNTLTDGETYTYNDSYSSAEDEEPNACLYSKADLILEGAGSLTVNANHNNGITSKDTLALYDGTITVNAANHGINGKDSCTVNGVTLTVTAGGDALRSTNDSDDTLGWVRVVHSTLELTAGEDGIQAETWASLSDNTCILTTGGGSAAATDDENAASAKGIKAGTDLALLSGVYTLDCQDDALHANGNVTISGGTFTLSSGDDGIHADDTLAISDGTISILTCYEGLEGAAVDVSGGVISIVSSDDGVNASDGTSTGFGGPGMGGNDNCSMTISGGFLSIQAGGDGLDSNGTLNISGGTILVSSTGNADGALDSDGTMTLTGGVLFAPSLGGMIQTPSDAAQCTLSVGFGETLKAGTNVNFTIGDVSYTFQLTGDATSAVFSAPELTSGSACTISYGGTYSGTVNQGLCENGTYADGTTLLEDVAIEDGVTTCGTFTGNSGRPGGMGGGNGGMRPDDGNRPSGGRPDRNGQAPDGQASSDGSTPPELPANSAQPSAAATASTSAGQTI